MSLTNINGLPFEKQKFDKTNFAKALNCLTYGVKKFLVYQSEVDIQLLVLLDLQNQLPNKLNVLDMRDVIDIQEKKPTVEFNSKFCLMVVENKL